MSVVRKVRSAGIGIALAAVALLGFATPAAAHDALIGSDPETGASVEVAPGQVTLTFSADLMADGAEAHVYAGSDPASAAASGAQDWAAGPAAVDGATLVIPLAEAVPAGEYSVNWRVVSSDGHPISTSDAPIISFTVTTGAATEAPASEAPVSETPAADAEAAPAVPGTDTVPVSPSPSVEPVAPTPATSDEPLSPVVVWTIVIGGVVVLALVGFIVKIGRKKPTP